MPMKFLASGTMARMDKDVREACRNTASATR
jgi:hypothetical protein